MIKSALVALVTAAGALGAPNAQAGVHWSVGINLPVVTVGAPAYYGYAPAPVVVQPAPVYAPAPVYPVPYYGRPAYYPRPVYYARPAYYPRPVYVAPAPVVYYGHPHGWHRGWR